MRRVLILLLILIFLLTGCSAPKDSWLPEVLVTLDGDAVLTREDLKFARIYEGVSPKSKGDNEELFLRLAAEAVCTRIAEFWGENAEREEIEAEYDIYLESLDVNLQLEAHNALREELPELTDDEFDGAFTEYLYRTASTETLLKSIAADYGNAANAEAIREGILANLWELSETMEIALYYPSLEDASINFEDVL